MAALHVDWNENERLRADLEVYVSQNLRQAEILNYMVRDYPTYPWSIPTLDRRLRFFGIKYIDYFVSIDDVRDVVQKELNGPGRLLGYRTMTQKIRTEHSLKVPRHLVYNVMTELDPDGVQERRIKKDVKKKKVPFQSDGPDWLHSLDGHDKSMGFQNWTFPIALYGSLDTFSRKLMFLKVWDSNSNPLITGRFFWEHLQETMTLPSNIRIDKGTETGKIATMQAYLRDHVSDIDDFTSCVKYGPSTTNKIERWWRDLNERLEKYFKLQLKSLLDELNYDPKNQNQRDALGYVFIPVVQRECNIFVDVWNSHRIRKQKGLELPTGIPNHMHSFPEMHGGERKGLPLTQQLLDDVRDMSGILNGPSFCIENQLMLAEFRSLLPDPETLQCSAFKDAYLFLKGQLNL